MLFKAMSVYHSGAIPHPQPRSGGSGPPLISDHVQLDIEHKKNFQGRREGAF